MTEPKELTAVQAKAASTALTAISQMQWFTIAWMAVELVAALTAAVRRKQPGRCYRSVILPRRFQLYPVGGGEAQTVKSLKDGEVPIQWDKSGTKLYVWDRTFPAHIFLVDLKTGARQPWAALVPPTQRACFTAIL